MKVALQFIASDLGKKTPPSRGDGLRRSIVAHPIFDGEPIPKPRIIPSLRDESRFLPFPGNELPGYVHLVPAGHGRRAHSPTRPFAHSRARQTPNAKSRHAKSPTQSTAGIPLRSQPAH
jgi:hypothetical protein